MIKKIIRFAFDMRKSPREVERMTYVDYIFLIVIVILILLPVLIFKF